MTETTGPLTAELRRALGTLHKAKPLGLARIPGGFRGIAGRVGETDGLALCAMKLARRDYSGRYPRLKITRQGTAALARPRADHHA